MAVEQGGRAPYATTNSILLVIDRHRQVGLKTMDLQKLQNIGVTESLAPRTMQTLVLLDFYDDKGGVTPEFDAMRKVAEHDFKPRLADLLRKAYAPIFEILDPTTATALDVENAFRGFEPTGQLSRMVQLFMGLMVFVGVMPEDQRKKTSASGAARTPVNRAGSSTASRRKDRGNESGRDKAEHETRLETPPPGDDDGDGFSEADGDTYVLYLVSGPKVTLTVKMDVMRASVPDREFIFNLVDALRTYDTDSDQTSGGKKKAARPQPKVEEVSS